jgi:hypothetical protein
VPTPTFNNWTTYGYDNARDGFNPNSNNISSASLSLLHLAWETQIDDYSTQTQPILATQIGSHAGVLIVGGGSGKAYGYDALTGSRMWATQLGAAELNCGASGGGTYYFGIGGSAVYDPSTGAAYIVSTTNSTVSGPTQVLVNQLNPLSGAQAAVVNIAPSPLPGEVDFGHTSLTLANGLLYAGTSSLCDYSSWRGSVVAVNESAMTVSNTFYTDYEQAAAPSPAPYSGGGVWGWGGASIDASGNVYFGVGNTDTNYGSSGPQTPFVQTNVETAGFGDQLVVASSNLSSVIASNLPAYTFNTGLSNDLDYSGSPMLAQPVGCDPAIAALTKSGDLFVYDATTINSGPVAQLQFGPSSGSSTNLGNPGYSPITGLVYSGVGSGMEPGAAGPGMVALKVCNSSVSQIWDTQFGPDSNTAADPRSMPTVTAGNVVFMGTPCERDSSGGCTGTLGTYGGALWALNASSGALLNGGNPIITTPQHIRMGVVVDADWVYLLDNGGDLYGFTIDPNFPPIQNTFVHSRRAQPRLRRL